MILALHQKTPATPVAVSARGRLFSTTNQKRSSAVAIMQNSHGALKCSKIVPGSKPERKGLVGKNRPRHTMPTWKPTVAGRAREPRERKIPPSHYQSPLRLSNRIAGRG